MNLKLTFDHYRAWVAFIQIFLCGMFGGILAWAYGLGWYTGTYYGMALGCGIYAAYVSDTSPLVRDQFGRIER
jgi:hypothetical protein